MDRGNPDGAVGLLTRTASSPARHRLFVHPHARDEERSKRPPAVGNVSMGIRSWLAIAVRPSIFHGIAGMIRWGGSLVSSTPHPVPTALALHAPAPRGCHCTGLASMGCGFHPGWPRGRPAPVGATGLRRICRPDDDSGISSIQSRRPPGTGRRSSPACAPARNLEKDIREPTAIRPSRATDDPRPSNPSHMGAA